MMKLDLNDSEVQALVGLLDAGIRQVGLRGVKDAADLISKIEAAQMDKQETGDGETKLDN